MQTEEFTPRFPYLKLFLIGIQGACAYLLTQPLPDTISLVVGTLNASAVALLAYTLTAPKLGGKNG